MALARLAFPPRPRPTASTVRYPVYLTCERHRRCVLRIEARFAVPGERGESVLHLPREAELWAFKRQHPVHIIGYEHVSE